MTLIVKLKTRYGAIVVAELRAIKFVGRCGATTTFHADGSSEEVTISADEAFKRIAEALRTGEVSVDLT